MCLCMGHMQKQEEVEQVILYGLRVRVHGAMVGRE